MLPSLRPAKRLLFAVCLLLLPAAFSFAQIINVTDLTSTPVPGSGHDYFKMFSETMNPANGSASIRIQLPVPPGRQLTLPFTIAYDSNGVLFFQALANASGGWTSDQRTFAQGGWQLTVPMVSDAHTQRVSGQYGQWVCPYYTGYVFYDARGVRHPLGLAYVPSPNSAGCMNQTHQLFSYLSGNDAFDQATWSSFDQTVWEPDGTKYFFNQLDVIANNGHYSALPVWIEDRNGNMLNFSWAFGSTSFSMTDTLGRTALSASNFGTSGGTVTVSGLSPYTLQWTTVQPSYSVYANPISGNGGCGPVLQAGGTFAVVSSITLPNAEAYQFQYDAKYGRVSQITYPTGGWVKYTWGLTDTLSEAVVYANSSGVDQACQYQMYAPVIRSRQVSFDGQNVALTQTFTYNTTWNTNPPSLWAGKTTTVTTSDKLRNLSSTTTYTYSPWYAPTPPNETSSFHEQIPTENVITYKDWGGSTNISTVTKGWTGNWADLLTSEQVTPDAGPTSETDYSYAASGQVKEKDEYDYGSPSHGALLRKTIINYASFSAPIYDRPSSIITYDGSSNRVAETDYLYDAGSLLSGNTTVGRDPNYNGNSSVPRGNATTKSVWLNTAGAFLSTSYAYDDTGQERSMTDPKGNPPTTYTYSDYNAYLGTINYPTTNGVPHSVSFSYNLADGQLATSTDQNTQTTSYQYNDPLGRLTEIDYPHPDGGQTIYYYYDTPGSVKVVQYDKIDDSQTYQTTKLLDGAGHVTRSQMNTDPDCSGGADNTDTAYDGLGRVWTVSNPYCSAAPDPNTTGTTTYTYDALGRVTSVKAPDNSTANTSYSANCATATDPQSHARKSCGDALGRMYQVIEDPSGLNYSTAYAYNVLDNLLTVTQGSQTRTFAYDSLSRLTSATNPESGATSYTYDANSNVTTKQDARGVTTSYVQDWNGNPCLYDALNRLVCKSYSDGTPAAKFLYDESSVALGSWASGTLSNPVGRLTHTTTVNSSGTVLTATVQDYDQMGRTKDYWQCTPYNCGSSSIWSSNYQHKYTGEVWQWAHPGGFTITNAISPARRITQISSSVNDPTHPPILAQNIHYTPWGALNTLQNGYAGSGANAQETYQYNNRLQPVMIQLGTTGNPAADYCLVYSYYSSVYKPSSCTTPAQSTTNNGNVMGYWYQDSAPAGFSHTAAYIYDGANRLSTATAKTLSGSIILWSQSYSYDRWGNGSCSGTGLCPTLTYNSQNNNQLASIGSKSFSYDAAGNLTVDPSNYTAHTYQWDAEGRVAKVDGGSTWNFTYNALGHRAQWAYGSSGAADQHLFDPAGNWLGVWWSYSLVRFGERALVVATGSETNFNHVNSIGSTSMFTNHSGTAVEDMLFYPWGDVWQSWGSGGYNFANLPYRDVTTTTDVTPARVFGPNFGRWFSPDPDNVGADSSDPQTWNMYAYARNNPTTNVDPDGTDYYLLGGENCHNAFACDAQGYVLDQNGNRQVITDQQVLNGDVGISSGLNGTTWLGTSQGTFEGQFFDNTPTSIDVNGTPGSAAAAVGTNLGIGMWNQIADFGNSFMTNLTVGQYSLNLPNVPGGLGNAAVSGQALAMLLPAFVPGGEEPTPGQLAQAEQVLLQKGRGAVMRGIRSFERLLARHESDLAGYQEAGAYTSKTESEIRNFKQLIQAYRQVLGR
jgi:RHS repeat-associated protein